MPEDRSRSIAVAVIRAWIEPGTEPGLRIRITHVADAAGAARATRVVSSAAEVCAVLTWWLERLADGSQSRNDSEDLPSS